MHLFIYNSNMKNFLGKLTIYILLLGTVLSLYILVIYFRPDLVDLFYYRFTTPKANSLILGSSRAAQGLKPEILNKKLGTNSETKIINHAFASGPSTIGPNYYKEITQKLNIDSQNGIFIISVTPWTFTTESDNYDDDSLEFFEVKQKLFVGNLKSSNSNPNFEYLWEYWNNKFSVFEYSFKYIINYGGILRLHADGWLEVSIDMDSTTVKNRIKQGMVEYLDIPLHMKWSNTRYYFFEKIINYLQKRGEIYFVRLPISKTMAELEYKAFPDFDNKMKFTANKYNIHYINFIHESGNYLTTDIHHLWKGDSEKISNQLSDSINSYRNNFIKKDFQHN